MIINAYKYGHFISKFMYDVGFEVRLNYSQIVLVFFFRSILFLNLLPLMILDLANVCNVFFIMVAMHTILISELKKKNAACMKRKL